MQARGGMGEARLIGLTMRTGPASQLTVSRNFDGALRLRALDEKVTHEIGQDLSLLSVEELTERIALMRSEIERLEAAMTKKRASRDAANTFFKS